MTRRPVWKILTAVAAALAGLAIAFAAWIDAVAKRRWASLEARMPELVAKLRARDARRPPRGEPLPGNAWDDYGKALDLMAGVSTSDLSEYLGGGEKADRGKVLKLLEQREGWRVPLAAGARREIGVKGLVYEDGFDGQNVSGLLRPQNLATFAAAKARVLFEEGKKEEATELLLDAAWLAVDAGRNTLLLNHMISCGLLATVVEEMRRRIGDLDPKTVGPALATLDASFPNFGDTLESEAVTALCHAVKGGGSLEGLGGALVAWRYGFSDRIMTADAMEAYLERTERLAAACRISWAEGNRVSKAEAKDMDESRNPLTRTQFFDVSGGHDAVAQSHARLRLLRMALDPGLELDDPFGGKLLRGDGKLWSRGRDGIDHGGHPKDDVVLELPK